MFDYTFEKQKHNMEFLQKHKLKIIGAVLGAIGGYAYYYFIGCSSGTCPITSNPYISVLYGALMGYLVFDMIKPKKQASDENN